MENRELFDDFTDNAKNTTGNNTIDNLTLFTDNAITIEIPPIIVHRWPSCDKEQKDHHLFDYRKHLFDLEEIIVCMYVES